MIILQGFQAIVWLMIIPYLLGKFITSKDEEKNKMLYTWVIGTCIQMGIFFVLAIPMILIRFKFQTLRNLYFTIIVILCMISIWLNRGKIIKISKFNLKSISIFQIVAIILTFLQVFIIFKYSNINNDDSSFVVLSNQMIDYGEMYYYEEGSPLNARRALAPISAYYSTLSQYLFVHVTIFTHTVFPIVLVILANVIYYYLGKTLFKEDKDSPYIFMLFMILANYYFFRIKGAGSYFFRFTWFGRSIVAGMLLPLLWKISLDCMNKEKNKIKDWLSLLFVVLASCLCSEMSVAIISIPIVILTIINSIRDKKLSYLLKSVGVLIPCLIIAICYLIIR